VSGGRNKLVFVNNGFTGGNIERVIDRVSATVAGSGSQVEVLSREEDLLSTCRSTIRATSNCIAAAVFFSSPDEGPSGKWNYTLRADGALESKIVVNSNKNDVEIYALPLQHAIDFAIAELNRTVNVNDLPSEVLEYPYTTLTAAERRAQIRTRYMGGVIDVLAVAFLIGMVGVTYQLTGLIATEREIGMAQLLDCMMPNRARWQPQMARIISNQLAFDLLYGPGWIVMAAIFSVGVFSKTSHAIVIVFHILAGLSLSSMSIFGAAFFHKAQLSGITSVIVSLLLGIIAQVAAKASTGAVAILSLLFPPMNYVYFVILLARWERQEEPASLVKSAPENPSTLPGIVLWIFLIIQIFAFPVLGALVERVLYGTASKSRTIVHSPESPNAVTVRGLTKEYRASWLAKNFGPKFGSHQEDVVAVNQLTLDAIKGQIVVLLGANGSGKSTILDAVAGWTQISAGSIELNYPGTSNSFGLCPQRNVLWDDLTVEEHVKIFNRIKCTGKLDSESERVHLIARCDVEHKTDARAKTLSGGQKRKLQLAIMFTGGSSICCVDEVSSGLDPISRRKIWDILLAARGTRSIILTTHFLDEADLLSDYIAILSKGKLQAEGTAVELKHQLGSGYRVHIYNTPNSNRHSEYAGIPQEKLYDQTVYSLTDSTAAAEFVSRLEQDGVSEYQVNGPTIEDVFLKVAEEAKPDPQEVARSHSTDGQVKSEGVINVSEAAVAVDNEESLKLMTGKRISMSKQAWTLFCKRATVLRRNYLPHAAALLIPIVAAGLVTLYLTKFEKAECTPTGSIAVSDIASLASQASFDLVVGPRAKLSVADLERFVETLPGGDGAASGSANLTGFLKSLYIVDTLEEFHDYISTNFSDVTPGGFFLGDGPSLTNATFAWRGNSGTSFATITQNAFDVLVTNVSISSQYQPFDVPWGASVGSALQLITYFGLAMAVYPAFFALYPTVERLRNVRGLQYSNGVRSLPLWLAYVSFDFIVVIVVSVVCIAIFAASSSAWYYIGYVFLVFLLYGLASTLLSYVISLVAGSQLSAFAFAAAGQAVMFLGYFIAYMSILTYSRIDQIDRNVNIAHFTIGLVSPIANVQRALFLSLNVFSITCRGHAFASYPGGITVYGGPILYLISQSLYLLAILLWWDSGTFVRQIREKFRARDIEEKHISEKEVSDELTRVESSHDGLRVIHLTKHFKKILAVEDVTFGVSRGEVFALLGPNGAGKSTIISLIRGDLSPTGRDSQVLVQDVSVAKHRAQARSYLGVCPQFDAMDAMTVYEHLHFYARIRGVEDPRHNVTRVIRAVGLQQYANRMAAKLSGGTKRKLSLAIALMGNPSVLLLDEPSSGMDAASKRVMWKTLASVVPGRSIVLTTHSMEEADALADRAGIMAGRMLALGTADQLRRKHGDAYHVHLVHSQAPHTPDEDMERIRRWVVEVFPSASVEEKTYHGQLRFAVPAGGAVTRRMSVVNTDQDAIREADDPGGGGRGNSVASLFTLLERNRGELGFEYYSVSQTTLDQVFLSIVGKHDIQEEEGARSRNKSSKTASLFSPLGILRFCF